MQKLVLSLMVVMLGGCAASSVVVRHPQTGDVQECRRGFWGTNATMDECAQPYLAKGYARIDPDLPLPPVPAQAPVPVMPESPYQPFQPYQGYQGQMPQQYPAYPVMPAPAAPAPIVPAAPLPGAPAAAAPAAPAEEEKPYFSQYPNTTSHKGWVLPEIFQ